MGKTRDIFKEIGELKGTFLVRMGDPWPVASRLLSPWDFPGMNTGVGCYFLRPIQFLSFIVPIFVWSVPLVSLILLKRSLVSHSIVFLYFFALTTEKGFLISPCCSLELCIQMGISFLFSFAFHFSSFHSWFVRPPQTAILPFCISFSWGWS